MADIKFMNLSENSNPSTTDSVLIGNAQDGMKRTSLGKIGDMFAVHGLLHFESVYTLLTDTKKQSYKITAPDVAGYTFAFWVCPSTIGNSFATYVESAHSNTTNIWIPTETMQFEHFSDFVNGKTQVGATAVYIKNTVAQQFKVA